MANVLHIVVCAGIVPDPLQTLEPVSGPAGPGLKNEMVLPAVLDPWAASALYEAAALVAKNPGSKLWLVSLGPKAKLQQVMMTVAQKVALGPSDQPQLAAESRPEPPLHKARWPPPQVGPRGQKPSRSSAPDPFGPVIGSKVCSGSGRSPRKPRCAMHLPLFFPSRLCYFIFGLAELAAPFPHPLAQQ